MEKERKKGGKKVRKSCVLGTRGRRVNSFKCCREAKEDKCLKVSNGDLDQGCFSRATEKTEST